MATWTKAEANAYIRISSKRGANRILFAWAFGAIWIVMKLAGSLDSWSWWWVTSPLWGSVAYCAFAIIDLFVFAAANDIPPTTQQLNNPPDPRMN